jgi:hypothetical protein
MSKNNCIVLKVALIALAFFGAEASYASELVAIDYTSGILYNVNSSNAALTAIGSTGVTGTYGFGDIQFAPNGTLYGTTIGPESALYTINPQTAAATLVGNLGISTYEGALAFAPNGTAYALNGLATGEGGPDQLLTINLATGAATIVASLGYLDLNGLLYRSDGMLVGVEDYTNSLVVINPQTGNVTTLASLPFSVGDIGGMTMYNGTGYFATGGTDSTYSVTGTDSLYSFNTYTGAYSLVGSFPSGIATPGISGLAGLTTTNAAPEPGALGPLALGLGGLGLMCSPFRRSAACLLRRRVR